MINICDNCKNNDVCKWCDDVTSTIEFSNTKDSSSPVIINVSCGKRRVNNAQGK